MFRRIPFGLEVLCGLGEYHPAVGASIEMGHEAIAFVTGLATFEKTRQLVVGQAIVGTLHCGDLYSAIPLFINDTLRARLR